MNKFFNPLENPTRYSLDDKGMGNAFADSIKDELRFVPEESCWYFYKDSIWIKDHGGMYAREKAKEYVDFLLCKALESGDADFITFAKALVASGTRRTMLDEAKSIHPLSKSEFDKNKNLFNCRNITFDLLKGEPRDHDPNDFITKVAPVHYEKDAKCERWLVFVDEIMCNDDEIIKYLQKALGYGITGETREECMFLLFGPTTRNGKGTMMETLLNILGDYAINMQPDSLAKRKRYSGSSPSPDIARNVGVRLVNVNEPAEDMLFDAAMVKQLTGSDTITARFLYGNSFDFIPQFKIYVSTNHLPSVTDDTLFSSGRIRVIPFNRHFGENEQDRSLKSVFRTEENKSAILNWLLEGLMMYRNEGLEAPQSVKEATLVYRKTTDTVGSFIDSVTVKDDKAGTRKTSDVYKLYRKWCSENAMASVTAQGFVGRLRNMELVKRNAKDGNVVCGMKIHYS